MSLLNFKLFASPASFLAGSHVKPRPEPTVVAKRSPRRTFPRRRSASCRRRRNGFGEAGWGLAGVRLTSRERLDHVEEMMLNLP